MIYLLYLLILLILLCVERQQISYNNIFRVIIPVIYILLIGFRGANVGVDTPVYFEHYYTFGQWGCDFVEVGFDWLNQFFYHHGYSQAPFFIVCAAFSVIPVAIAVNQMLTRHEYSIFMLLFCTTTFASLCNGMRQNMACGLLFYLVFWFERTSIKSFYKICLWFLGILFASLFHVSVFLVLPIFFLRYCKISNKTYVVLYVLSFLFVMVNISSYLPDIQLGHRDYGRYLGSELANKSASFLGFFITTIRNLLFLSLLIKNNLFTRYPLFANLAFVMLILTNMGYHIPIIGRVNMYFVFFYIYMLSIILGEGKRHNMSVYTSSYLLIVIVIVLTVYGFISPSNKLMPYNFYWENSSYTNYLQ